MIGDLSGENSRRLSTFKKSVALPPRRKTTGLGPIEVAASDLLIHCVNWPRDHLWLDVICAVTLFFDRDNSSIGNTLTSTANSFLGVSFLNV